MLSVNVCFHSAALMPAEILVAIHSTTGLLLWACTKALVYEYAKTTTLISLIRKLGVTRGGRLGPVFSYSPLTSLYTTNRIYGTKQ